MTPQDAALAASLEYQYRELTAAAARAERLRGQLVPPSPAVWRGGARRAYETATHSIAWVLDEVVAALNCARGNTASALEEVTARV